MNDAYRVDSNNDPIPENFLTPTVNDDNVMYHEWGSRSNIYY